MLASGNPSGEITFTLPVGEEAGTSKCHKLSDFKSDYTCGVSLQMTFTAMLNFPGTHSWYVDGNLITGQNGVSFTHDFSVKGPHLVKHSFELNGEVITTEKEVEVFEIMQGFTISSNHQITVGNGYDEEIVISGDMVIENNALVVIGTEMTLRFCGANSKLIIEPGSTLYLNGKLTDLGDQTWKGVEVLGNLQPQTSSLVKGKFFGMPPAIIENAKVAISNGAKFTWSYGGHIICNRMLFLKYRGLKEL
ncbi:MAG: hypothetical protein ACI8YQ_001438 [Polaribacter sp.]